MWRFGMKKILIVLLVIMTSWAMVYGQTVNVTFKVNTAAVPDTLGPNSTVQIRGGGGPLTWDNESPVILTNIGGDYWEGTFAFPENTADIPYKIFTNAKAEITAGDGGWEGNIVGGNRMLTTAGDDIVLDLQFANGWKSNPDPDQFETPYDEVDSTFVCYIRVNMHGFSDFDPANHVVGVRGSNTADWGQTGELGWGETYLLTQETNHVNGGSQQYNGTFFWSGPVHVPDMYAGTGIKFKVVVHNANAPLDEDWGDMVANPGREDEIAISGNDTTFHWFWFDNMAPVTRNNQDTVIVTWNADMANAIAGNGFAPGDTVEVRWGYFGTAVEEETKMMTRQGFSTVWSATDTVVTTVGANLDYQYYKIKDGVAYREVFYNFDYDGDNAGEQERRMVDPVAGNNIVINDVLDSRTSINRMPVFRNTAVLAQPVLVTFTCDARPAYYTVMAGKTLEDIQGQLTIDHPDSVIAKGMAINGPAVGGWGNDQGLPDWGAHNMTLENKAMYDDGTHGDDTAGDSVYAIQVQFDPDSGDVVGQEFKFGIGGGDNEGGEGGYGNNHIENIDDTGLTATIASQFGSINPSHYDAWDFDNMVPITTDVDDGIVAPYRYALDRNYPNPFNPTTHIQYELATAGQVKLVIFDILGKQVASLVDQRQTAGRYQVTWDGRDSMGRRVATGVYFYRIESGDFNKTQKMLLMK